MTGSLHQQRLALGAYVLGALDPAERAELEAHLSGCAGCRGELAELAGLPGLLGRLDPTDVDAATVPPPARLVEVTLGELGRRRRRDRRRHVVLAGAAAVLVGASGAGAALAVAQPSRPAFRVDARTGVSAGPQTVAASAQLRAQPWGTALTLRISGVPAGTRCRLIAVGRGGRQEVAGSWQVSYTGQANVEGATAIARHELTALQVLDENNTPIAVLPASQ